MFNESLVHWMETKEMRIFNVAIATENVGKV